MEETASQPVTSAETSPGVVDKLLADLRLGKLRDLSGLVLKKNGEGHLMRVVGNRSRCLFADELPADGCDDCHNENNHQKVNQIDFAEQTTLFINNFHTCLQLLGNLVDSAWKIDYNNTACVPEKTGAPDILSQNSKRNKSQFRLERFL